MWPGHHSIFFRTCLTHTPEKVEGSLAVQWGPWDGPQHGEITWDTAYIFPNYFQSWSKSLRLPLRRWMRTHPGHKRSSHNHCMPCLSDLFGFIDVHFQSKFHATIIWSAPEMETFDDFCLFDLAKVARHVWSFCVKHQSDHFTRLAALFTPTGLEMRFWSQVFSGPRTNICPQTCCLRSHLIFIVTIECTNKKSKQAIGHGIPDLGLVPR